MLKKIVVFSLLALSVQSVVWGARPTHSSGRKPAPRKPSGPRGPRK